MNFPNKEFGHPCQKRRAAKVNEYYTNPSVKVIFSAFLTNYGRNRISWVCGPYTYMPILQHPTASLTVYCRGTRNYNKKKVTKHDFGGTREID